jgi:hypothetical protein
MPGSAETARSATYGQRAERSYRNAGSAGLNPTFCSNDCRTPNPRTKSNRPLGSLHRFSIPSKSFHAAEDADQPIRSQGLNEPDHRDKNPVDCGQVYGQSQTRKCGSLHFYACLPAKVALGSRFRVSESPYFRIREFPLAAVRALCL